MVEQNIPTRKDCKVSAGLKLFKYIVQQHTMCVFQHSMSKETPLHPNSVLQKQTSSLPK